MRILKQGRILLMGAALMLAQLMQSASALPPSVNKFNPDLGQEAIIQTEMTSAGILDIKIYDRTGNEIRLLTNEFQNPGQHPIVWDGLDGDGQQAEPGVYVAIIQEGDNTRVLNLVLIR